MPIISAARKRKRPGTPEPEVAPSNMFYPLTVHIVAGDASDSNSEPVDGEIDPDEPIAADVVPVVPDPSPAPPPTTYEAAVARIESLRSHLTQSMALDLTSLLSVINSDLLPSASTDHPLITQIANPEITNDEIASIAKTIGSGLAAFLARGWNGARKPNPPPADVPLTPEAPGADAESVKTPSSRRSRVVTACCAERDDSTCCLTGQRAEGNVAHIIPFSVRSATAVNFWKFIAMVRGDAATATLRTVALGAAHSTDTLRNVWWLCSTAHIAFDAGKITLIPELSASQLPYNPATVSEVPLPRSSVGAPTKFRQYTARVEFPAGQGELSLAVVTYRRRGGRAQLAGLLRPGATITLRTPDPVRLPLPHPLLFQLHAVCSRVLAIKAAAGWQPDSYHDDEEYDDGEEEEVQYEEEGEDEDEDEVVYWPHVPGGPSGMEVCQTVPPCVMRVESSEVTTDEEGKDAPRWPSVVSSEYAARMEEMWRKCAERLGREVRGGKWWA